MYLIDVLQKRTSSVDLKQHTVDYLTNHTKSFHYTRKVLKELEAQILEEIKELGGNDKLENVVMALSLVESEEHL